MLTVTSGWAQSCEVDGKALSWNVFEDQSTGLFFCYPNHTWLYTAFQPTYFKVSNLDFMNGQKLLQPSQYHLAELRFININTQNGQPSVQGTYFSQILKRFPRPKNAGGYYYRVFLRIGVSSNKTDLMACYQSPHNQQARIQSIDGLPFHVYNVTDVGMSQFLRAEVYRLRLQHHCLAMDLVETGGNLQLSQTAQQALTAHYVGLGRDVIKTLKIPKS